MRSLAGKPPVHTPKYRVADYNCLNVKLKTYYARKRKLYEDTYPDFYDNDLRQLFSAPCRWFKASSYLRRTASPVTELPSASGQTRRSTG